MSPERTVTDLLLSWRGVGRDVLELANQNARNILGRPWHCNGSDDSFLDPAVF